MAVHFDSAVSPRPLHPSCSFFLSFPLLSSSTPLAPSVYLSVCLACLAVVAVDRSTPFPFFFSSLPFSSFLFPFPFLSLSVLFSLLDYFLSFPRLSFLFTDLPNLNYPRPTNSVSALSATQRS